MLLLYAFVLSTLSSMAYGVGDYLVYQPTSVSSFYTNIITTQLGKTYDTATAAQFATMTVAQFQQYRAIVFGDPNCRTSPILYLPSTNLDNLWSAANGWILIIGTDELYHSSQAGPKALAKSGLAWVGSDLTKTGVYLSLSCYYDGAGVGTPVPFLAPLGSFLVRSSSCNQNAHIVASHPALNDLSDGVLSNWGCSTHEFIYGFPSDFQALAIVPGASGAGARSFPDGTSGVPYIIARGVVLDQCHTSTCSSGTCTSTPKADGTPCDDGNACTSGESCHSGNCNGGTSTVCAALDQCHAVGTCNPSTGDCSNPNKPDGASCSDNNACTLSDTCQAGSCTSRTPKVCSARDQCHDAGTCDPSTGDCSNPTKADGSSCDDENACTSGDTCQAGTCADGTIKVCSALDQCHDAGTCDPSTGDCSNPTKADGTSCSDGNACTLSDICQAGSCTSGAAKVCSALDQCHDTGTCDPSTGDCSNPTKADGTSCDDENACTSGDTCLAGSCTSGTPTVCVALDQCHDPGMCDPSTGECSNPNKADGTSCSDGNLCTLSDTCQAGSCTSGIPKICSALDPCHDAGTCDPSTGDCSNPNKPDGTSCDDGLHCTINDKCNAGSCRGEAVVCLPRSQCHHAGTCNPATGACTDPQKSNGTPCDDMNACTSSETCQSGVCGSGTYLCCYVEQQNSCGACVENCGRNHTIVLEIFQLHGTSSDVSAAGGGGNVCPRQQVCCQPRDQSTVVVNNGVCAVRIHNN